MTIEFPGDSRGGDVVQFRSPAEEKADAAWAAKLSAQVESQLVGRLLLHPEDWERVNFLRPEHFTDGGCAHVIKRFIECVDAKESPSPIRICQRSQGVLAFERLMQMVRDSTMLIVPEEQARHVYEDWHYRKLAELVDKARISRDTRQLMDIRSEYDRVMQKLAGQDALRVPIASAMERMMGKINDIMEGRAETGIISTGWNGLDRDMGGYRPGELVICAARPAMGKTIFGLVTARRVAHRGRGVLIHSLEIDELQCSSRMIADEVHERFGRSVKFKDIMQAQLGDEAYGDVFEATNVLKRLPLETDMRAGIGVQEIAQSAERWAEECERRRTPMGLLVVDYLGLMRHGSGKANGYNRAQEIGDTTMALKQIAKDLSITVLTLVQLSRDVEKREVKKPVLSDLRDSGSIEQDADVVMFLFREEYYERMAGRPVADSIKNRVEVITSKNRPGETGITPLDCNVACNVFRDPGGL